jgi:HK97 family phage prohead protease
MRAAAAPPPADPVPVVFSIDIAKPIDQMLLEMKTATGRVGRPQALSIPGVLRGRNMICGISTLPLQLLDADRNRIRSPLLEQIDPQVPNVVTMAQTVEDLLFEGLGWWQILGFGWDGYPVSARHVDVDQVSLDPPPGYRLQTLPSGIDPSSVVWIEGRPVDGRTMIRFDSPNPGVLQACGRTIRRAVEFERAASMYARDPKALEYFTPTEGADPVSDDKVVEILGDWEQARRDRAAAYVPAALDHHTVDWLSPADLQLVELQKQATLDVANCLGLDPEDLGVSTTSRTYQNAVDRRVDRINDVFAGYMRAITDRLSMGDVTRRGQRAQFDLDDYLKADPKTRWETYEIGLRTEAVSVPEVRKKEDLPDIPVEPRPVRPAPVPPAAPQQGTPMMPAQQTQPAQQQPALAAAAAAAPASVRFSSTSTSVTFDLDPAATRVSVSEGTREITGLVLPYGVSALSQGRRWRFAPDALRYTDVHRVKLLVEHDYSQAIGRAVRAWSSPEGLWATFKVARGDAGDRALAMAADGVWDGLSVGVDMAADGVIPDPTEPGTLLVLAAAWRETSLTPKPSFDAARVASVAASRGAPMQCPSCGTQHAPGTPCPTQPAPAQQFAQTPPPAAPPMPAPAQGTAPVAPGWPFALPQQAPQAPPAPTGVPGQWIPQQGGQQFAQQPPAAAAGLPAGVDPALVFAVAQVLGQPQLLQPGQVPQLDQRQVVNPRGAGPVFVREELPYRFAGGRAEHEFSTDLIAASKGSGEATARLEKFLAVAFADAGPLATTDVNELNPTRQRPDLYVDQLDYTSPIWSAINKGTMDSVTPFTLPKFLSSTQLVADHTEGTEPDTGEMVTTSQTITPTPVSGKVEVNREAWDQGGNPQLSGLLWRQMTRAWSEALESAAVTMLEGLVLAGLEWTITTAAEDSALQAELDGNMAMLQFIRGGFTMRDLFLQADLYKAIVGAVDLDGRKLYPIIGASNANGTASQLFADVNIAGLRGRPAWALAASGVVSANSYLFNRDDVSGWASAPQRLQFEYQVKNIYVGLWGYKALACTRTDGIRRIKYDPVA